MPRAGFAPDRASTGFTLVELLVSVAIVALALVGIAGPWGIGSTAFQQSRVRNNQEAAIDDDIAVMEDLAFRYTCCPGSCTTDSAVISAALTCKGVGGVGTPAVGSEYYYFPYYAPASSGLANVDAFAGSVDQSPRDGVYENGLCHTTTDLVAADVTRSVVVDDAALHRIRLTYTGTNLSRVVLIVPAVAAWCP